MSTSEFQRPHPVLDGRDVEEWRWQNYFDHLADLGYDLDGGRESVSIEAGAIAELSDAVTRYLDRSSAVD